MLSIFNQGSFRNICDDLKTRDADLAYIIDTYSYPPMWTRPNTFETLVHIILEQQVSLASALAALNKLKEKIGEVTPEKVLALTDEEMKAAYFSRQKMGYVRYLAQAIIRQHIDLEKLALLPDEEVRAILVTLKGVGNWTVDVYLMFALQRADLFPIGDLAAVNALKRIKNLPKDTPRESLQSIARTWQPYRTIATMILWHFYLSAQ